MGQMLRERHAVMKDVPTKLSREEYVPNMVQRGRGRLAVMRDVPTLLSREEFVLDTVQRNRKICTIEGCINHLQGGSL